MIAVRSKSSSRITFLGLLAIILCTLIARPAHAQTSQGDYRLSTESFRYLLKRQGFTSLNSISDLSSPKGKVLIVLGDPKPLELLPNGIIEFMRDGGAILFATDYPVVSGPLLKELRIQVSGELAKCLDKSADLTYHALEDCPIVQPDSEDFPGFTSDLRQGLATNKPSYLRYDPPRIKGRLGSIDFNWPMRSIGYLAEGCVYEDERTHSSRSHNKPELFGLAGSFLAGRVLILADHSVFINQMMQQVDNGNAEFANRCIKWLQGENGERKEVLFIENGEVKTLDIELKRLPSPPPDMKLDLPQVVNQLLSSAEEENVFDLILNSLMPRDWNPSTFRVLLFGIGFLAFSLIALGMARYKRLSGVPLLSKAVAQSGSELALVEQRNVALLKSGNWSEAAQDLGRRFFEEVGIHGDKLPVTKVRGSFYKNWRVRRRLRQVWDLANARSPHPFTPDKYQDLQRLIRHMKADLAHGTLTFLSVNSPREG
jgi:hypothetical protein